MAKFIIALRDEVTIARLLFVEVEANTEDQAKGMVQDNADDLVAAFNDSVEESDINVVAWEAELSSLPSTISKLVNWDDAKSVIHPLAFVWDGDTDTDDQPCNYLNHYECDDCSQAWEDRWSCACDDECPECGGSVGPSYSDVTNLDTGEVERQEW